MRPDSEGYIATKKARMGLGDARQGRRFQALDLNTSRAAQANRQPHRRKATSNPFLPPRDA